MAITITISPEAAVEKGAKWRILSDGGAPGAWMGSDESADLAEPRPYLVEFAPAPGWRTPERVRVRNVVGAASRKAVVYTPMSVHGPGRIPPQTAWHGQCLEFLIPPAGAGAIELSSEPVPEGALVLDAATGLFRYTPAPADKFPFQVTFSRQDGGAKQTFEITPMPLLPPEVVVFGGGPATAGAAAAPLLLSAPAQASALSDGLDRLLAIGAEAETGGIALPAPFSLAERIVTPTFLGESGIVSPQELSAVPLAALPDGLLGAAEATAPGAAGDSAATFPEAERPVIETVENGEELFNSERRSTSDVRIVGRDLVLEQGSEAYDRLHANPAVRRLEVYAETVTLRAPLHLPQTTVSIHARELRFEDQADAVALLRTTPLDYPTCAAPATRKPVTDDKGQVVKDATGTEKCTVIAAGNGLNGARAGDVALHLEACTVSGPFRKRFILTGGRGQNPGPGLPGRDGARLAGTATYGQANMAASGWKIVYGEHTYKKSFWYKTHTETYGKKAWPTDGEPGIAAGMPGRGGDGGRLTATLDLAALVEAGGGAAGERGPAYPGGAAGEPQLSAMIRSWDTHDGLHNKWGWDYLNHEGKTTYMTNPGPGAVSPAGQAGSPGGPAMAGHPLSWLHPLFLHHLLEGARNDYLAGAHDGVRERIAGYAELLDIYQGLDAWRELTDTDRLELGRLRNEMAGLLSRLDCRLDYFGNPAGWVPMLSFEVNLTVFDNEIDRAIDLLYMSYWLQRKAKDDTQRVETLVRLQVKLKQEVEDLKGRYARATETVPELEAEAARIANQINLLQEQLHNLEEELRKKAEAQLEEPWWKTGLKIAGTLCSVVPFWQPALGAAGGLMKLGADFDKDDPWQTITGAADVAKTFCDARVADKKEEFELVAKKVDTKAKEFKALKSAKNIQDAATSLTKGLEGVAKVVADRQVPKSEVDALLLKLEAESEDFKKISGELKALLDRKMVFAQKLAEALQLVAEIPKAMTADLLAIDAAAEAAATGRNVLHDGRLTMHLEVMDRKARERLLKYHYYLAKSYEYRLLRRYPGQLDLDGIFTEMERVAELNVQGDKPFELSREQFASLKGVYRATLASIAEETLDACVEDPPDLSAPRRFSLSGDEISRLNAGKTVTINPMALGLFRLVEENVRIADLAVERLDVAVEGGGERRLAELDLRFEHPGIFQLRQGGRTIRFQHPVRGAAAAIAWGARRDAYDNAIDAIKPSPAADSLLRSLLKSDTAGNMMLYAQPSAWGDILVRREVNTEPGTTVRIEAVRLNLTYNFSRESAGVHTVHVKTVPAAAELSPYFVLDRADLNGRADGRGDFYRAYKGAQTLELVAQEHYGRWRFERWADAAGTTLAKTRQITVAVDDDRQLQAVYAPAG
jgi:hypothetical protein